MDIVRGVKSMLDFVQNKEVNMNSLLQLFFILIVVVLFFKHAESLYRLFLTKKEIFYEKRKIKKQTQRYELRGFLLLQEGYSIKERDNGQIFFTKKGCSVFFEEELRGFSDLKFNEKINEKINKK